MPEYCYIAIAGNSLLRLDFGSNHAEEIDKKGTWKSALEINMQMGILPHITFAMFVCYMFQHWPIYEYLSNLDINSSFAIFNFVNELGRTRFSGDVHSLNSEMFNWDAIQKKFSS